MTEEIIDPAPQKSDIVSIGGAAMDVFVRAPHSVSRCNGEVDMIQFPLGEKVKVEEVFQACGGGATNTSVGFSRLGLSARFCGVIGDDEWGRQIQHTLVKEGVMVDAAIIVEQEVSSFSIVLVDSTTGRRSILYSPNVNAHMCDPVFPRDILKQSSWIFLNHLSDVSHVILDDCLELVKKPEGLRFAWNPGGTQIRQGIAQPMIASLLPETDMLFLNKEEAFVFTDSLSIHDAFAKCMERGVKHMCISDGGHGAYLCDGSTVYFADVPKDSLVVDATGAGDAFAVGVTWGIMRNLSLPDCLRAGMINAASVIRFIGTQRGLLTDTDIVANLRNSNIEVNENTLSS